MPVAAAPTPAPTPAPDALPAGPMPQAGVFAGAVHLFAVRVYFEDTDLSGVVYHANYLRWFERARSDMLRGLGIDQRAAFAAGDGAFAVSDLAIRYRAPARLDDAVRIETRGVAVGAASCRLHQIVRRDGAVLAEAHVRVGFVGADGRPRRLPASWRAAFARIASPVAPDPRLSAPRSSAPQSPVPQSPAGS